MLKMWGKFQGAHRETPPHRATACPLTGPLVLNWCGRAQMASGSAPVLGIV